MNYHKKHMQNKRLILNHDQLNMIGYSLFLLSMYSVGTISSYTSSWTYTMLILALSAILMFVANYKRVIISPVTSAWILVIIICLIASVRTMDFRDFIFYALTGIVIILSYSVPGADLYSSLFVVVAGAVVFSAGIYIQFFFPGA